MMANKFFSKALSVGLSLSLCASLVAPALAVTYDISKGNVTIGSSADGVWSMQAGNSSVSTDTEIIVTGETTQNTVTVKANTENAKLTLSDTNIDVSGTNKVAVDIRTGSNVTVELDGTNEVKSGSGKAGVSVGDGASLTITDEDKDGSLTATGGNGGAGIGGGNSAKVGDIAINGGTIIATGGGTNGSATQGGAGIGSGAGGSVNSVTINDGNVTATGGNGGAGIGAGHDGTFMDITVNGGKVTANGGQSAAGIGTGRSDYNTTAGDSIDIKSGEVTAVGGKGGNAPGNGGGAGIGTGISMVGQKVDQINITGGTVNATGGGALAAGIGSSAGKPAFANPPQRVDEINISGDTTTTKVTATGGGSAAGIGAGSFSSVGKVNIAGGTVNANGTNGAGIGTGTQYSTVTEINISGGDVTAAGINGGAGIGSSSSDSRVETINISGGKVTANGHSNAAGIGGGNYGSFGAINISGGDITAKSGILASGIGNGSVNKGGTIAISGVENLVVLGDTYFAIDTRADVSAEQTILNGQFLEHIKKAGNGLSKAEKITFIVVDANGAKKAEFTLDSTVRGDMYESFAVNLPEGGTYYVFPKDQSKYSGSIVKYGETGKQVAYVISENDMLSADLMQFPSFDVSYSFAGENLPNGVTLPEEVTGQQPQNKTGEKLTGLELDAKLSSFDIKDVTTEEGTWSFKGWTADQPIQDGQLTDVKLVGTWSFTCAHSHTTYTVTANPTCTEEGAFQTTCDTCGEVVETGDVPAIGHAYDNGVITRMPTATEDGEMTYTCAHDPNHTYTRPIPATGEVPDPEIPLGPEPDDTEIEDPEIPLAGLFTRGDAIGYLWEQSGSPEADLSTFEDVPEDHVWAVAIGWAQDMGIARADEEGNFRPDDLVLRGVEDLEIDPEGELQEFLNWYAEYAGVKLDAGEFFIELEGALDDVIMGEEAQVIFDDFFARLATALSQAA